MNNTITILDSFELDEFTTFGIIDVRNYKISKVYELKFFTYPNKRGGIELRANNNLFAKISMSYIINPINVEYNEHRIGNILIRKDSFLNLKYIIISNKPEWIY
jgi:hypothetical protein